MSVQEPSGGPEVRPPADGRPAAVAPPSRSTHQGPVDEALALVPWPYVERRSQSRREDGGGSAGRGPSIPRQSDSSEHETPGAVPAATAIPAPRAEDRDGRGRRAGWAHQLVLVLVCNDALVGFLAAVLANLLRFDGVSSQYAWGALVVPPVWVAAIALNRGYERRWFGTGAEEFRSVLRAGTLLACGAAVVSYALHAELARGYVLPACAAAVLGSLGSRLAFRSALRALRRRGRATVDVVLVGDESSVAHLVRQLAEEPGDGLRLVGACVPGGRSKVLEVLGVAVLSDLDRAGEIVRRLAVHTVAVTACAEMSGPALRRLAWQLEGRGVDLVVAPGLVDVAGPRLHIRPLCGLPLLHIEEPELIGAWRIVKAALDRAGAVTGLVLLGPLLLAVAIAVRVSSPGPVLYAQARVGKDGRMFRLWKFRTMFVDADERWQHLRQENLHGAEVLFKLRQDPRVTGVGRLLRRFSLDELPQLVNVLLGQMSLVGPRPPLPREVARYGAGVHRRLLVKPGLTGLWQIGGRADLSWDESIRLDLRYVENWSLSLDIMILWKTVSAVISGRGAY